MFSKDADPDELIRKTAVPRLDLLPADESLRELDSLFARLGKKRRLARLTEELARRYERIVLDCPPVLNEISAQVIRAADCVIVPLPPSPLSARAFELVIAEIRAHAKDHPPILPVLSMLDLRRALHRAAREENPELAGDPAGERDRAMRGAAAAGRPVRPVLARGEGIRAAVDRDRAQADRAKDGRRERLVPLGAATR